MPRVTTWQMCVHFCMKQVMCSAEVPVHRMEAYEKVDVLRQTFLTSPPGRGDWSTLPPVPLYPEKNPSTPTKCESGCTPDRALNFKKKEK